MTGATCSATPSHIMFTACSHLFQCFWMSYKCCKTNKDGTYQYKSCFQQPAGLLVAIACGPGCAAAQLHGKNGLNVLPVKSALIWPRFGIHTRDTTNNLKPAVAMSQLNSETFKQSNHYQLTQVFQIGSLHLCKSWMALFRSSTSWASRTRNHITLTETRLRPCWQGPRRCQCDLHPHPFPMFVLL